MLAILSAANPSRTLTLSDVELVGFTAENGVKLLLTLGLVLLVWALGRALQALARLLVGKHRDAGLAFALQKVVTAVATSSGSTSSTRPS